MNPVEQRHSKSRVAAARLDRVWLFNDARTRKSVQLASVGALRVYTVRGPLELVTVFQVDYGRFARFICAQSVASSVNSQRFPTG
jgi:hypothetical protein